MQPPFANTVLVGQPRPTRVRKPSSRPPSTPNQLRSADSFPRQPSRLAQPPNSANFNWESTLAPPPTQYSKSFATKSFYVRPFDPSTTVDQIAAYIHGKTGWDSNYFNCHRLTSGTRSDTRPLTFVSFKVTVPDSLDFTSIITSNDFWPSFVSVEQFTLKRRS